MPPFLLFFCSSLQAMSCLVAALLRVTFEVQLHRREKRLLASWCPPVRLSACISASPAGRISVKFGVWDFHENVSINSPDVVKIG
jgi:hypothetical protein